MAFVNNVFCHLVCKCCNTRAANESMIQVKSEESLVGASRKKLLSKCIDQISNKLCASCGAKGQNLILSIYCGERPRQLRFHISRNELNQMAIFISDERDVDFLEKEIDVKQIDILNSNVAFFKRAIMALDNAYVRGENSNNDLDEFLFVIYEEPVQNLTLADVSGEIVVNESKNFSELMVMSVCHHLREQYLT